MLTRPGIATVPRPSRRSSGSAGGAPLPTHAITPSSTRTEPPAISVPASSIVTTTSHASIRRRVTTRRPASRPPRAGRRRGSSRSPCTGRGCRRAPRGPRARRGTGSRSSRSVTATTSPGVQKPHCTAPAVDERLLDRVEVARRVASPSTVRTSRPSACAARTRQAQTTSPSSHTEHEPHSPCSHAFFEPRRPSYSRSIVSRLASAQTSASRHSPFTRRAHPHQAAASPLGRPGRATAGPARVSACRR